MFNFLKKRDKSLSEREKEIENTKHELLETIDNIDKLDKYIEKYKTKNVNLESNELFKIYKVNKPNNLFHIKGHKNNLINKFNPTSSLLINMELVNGKYIEFIIKIRDNGFVFNDGFYIIDENCLKYNESAQMYSLTYHESLALPINKTINIKNINKELDDNNIELSNALNPISLQKFMTSTVIQKLLAGAEMENQLSFIKMIVIINLIVSVIAGIIIINMSGLI